MIEWSYGVDRTLNTARGAAILNPVHGKLGSAYGRGPLATLSILAVLITVGLAPGVLAQTPRPPNLPAIDGVLPPGGTPIPLLAPRTQPQVGPGRIPAPVRPAAGIPGSVAVGSVVFEGATAFPAQRLAQVAGLTPGPAVAVEALEVARAALVSLYRTEGYAFVTADAVLGADGVLRFTIAEGFISEVRLEGDIGPAGSQVLRFLNRLIGVQPLDVARLDRQLLLAQDIPGITIRTVLRPAGTSPGALSLVAQISRAAVSGYLTADNRGARFSGPEQGLAAVQFNSFTTLGERTEIALYYGRGNTQLYGQGSVQAFIGGSGLAVRLYAGRGQARPSGALRGIGYQGDTTVVGAALTYPVIRQRSQTLILTGAFDAIDSEILLDDAPGSTRTLSRDRIRALRLGADWTRFDLWLGEAKPATNTVNFRISRGVDAFGATSGDTPLSGRVGARPDFTRLNLDLSRTQALFSPWAGALISLQATLAGQWTHDVLPISEKYYLGGARLGRGFYAGEVTGDRAVAGSLELQLATTHETSAFGLPLRLLPTYYLFADHGRTFENLASDADRRLTSAGIGVRVQFNERFEAQLEGVRRITRQPSGVNTPRLSEDALFWRVLARF